MSVCMYVLDCAVNQNRPEEEPIHVPQCTKLSGVSASDLKDDTAKRESALLGMIEQVNIPIDNIQ